MAVTVLTLPGSRLNTYRTLDVYRFGQPDARPKVYIQAGLHADEIPGLLVADHVIRRLSQATVHGEVVIVPVANPIGLDQVVNGTLLGRHALTLADNFNRGFPDHTDAVMAQIGGRLGHNGAANVALVRAALRTAHDAVKPRDEVEGLRHALLGLALDADIVLDLHCDQEAVLHLYTTATLWPELSDLAALLDCRAVLVSRDCAAGPFEDTCSTLWPRLRGRLDGALPLPDACLAATIELRGQGDVDDALAAADAGALIRFLQRRGVVAGDPGPVPAFAGHVAPLEGTDRITSPVPGVILHHRAVGDWVDAGAVVAEVVQPGGTRTALTARTSGLIWMRNRNRMAGANDIIAGIAGTEIIAGTGTIAGTEPLTMPHALPRA